jgi:hypothetical protein
MRLRSIIGGGTAQIHDALAAILAHKYSQTSPRCYTESGGIFYARAMASSHRETETVGKSTGRASIAAFGQQQTPHKDGLVEIEPSRTLKLPAI